MTQLLSYVDLDAGFVKGLRITMKMYIKVKREHHIEMLCMYYSGSRRERGKERLDIQLNLHTVLNYGICFAGT